MSARVMGLRVGDATEVGMAGSGLGGYRRCELEICGIWERF